MLSSGFEYTKLLNLAQMCLVQCLNARKRELSTFAELSQINGSNLKFRGTMNSIQNARREQ